MIVSYGVLQLFRTDFITAMKLPDMEPLGVEEYSVITDAWKPDWEKGVQVPVDEDAIKEPSCWCVIYSISVIVFTVMCLPIAMFVAKPFDWKLGLKSRIKIFGCKIINNII